MADKIFRDSYGGKHYLSGMLDIARRSKAMANKPDKFEKWLEIQHAVSHRTMDEQSGALELKAIGYHNAIVEAQKEYRRFKKEQQK